MGAFFILCNSISEIKSGGSFLIYTVNWENELQVVVTRQSVVVTKS